MERLQEHRHALGSEAYITLVSDRNLATEPVFASLWSIIEDFEERFSRFKETSELSNLNLRAGEQLSASPEMIALLKTAKSLAVRTDGLYNPFILPALQEAGYQGSWPHPSRINATLDYQHRHIVDAEESITIRGDHVAIPANTALDFGGIGKGYLLDLLATELDKQGAYNYWISLGGDIICRGVDLSLEPWEIAIQDAHDATKNVGKITSKEQPLAIATSGITKRRGSNWHHIIDPRSGKPADTDLLTATVCLPSATEADVFAKCLVILGSQKAQQFIKKQSLGAVLLQPADKRHNSIRIGDI